MHGGAAGDTMPRRERVLQVITRGGLAGRNPRVWAAQFDALIRDVGGRPRADPVQHWVISFRSEGAPMSLADWEQRLDAWLKLMNARGLPVVAAVHGDTGNPHCHIVLCRVDPVTRKMRPVGGRRPLDRAQEVVAILDHRYGLSPEQGALYRFDGERLWCNETGEVAREGRGRFVPMAERRKRARAKERPVASAGITPAGAAAVARILRGAGSWTELGGSLAALGLAPGLTRGPKGGRGLRLAATDGSGRTWKASAFGRDCALAALERRLGPATGVAEATVPGRAAAPGGPARIPPPAAVRRPVPGGGAGHGTRPRGSGAAWAAYEIYREALEEQRQALVREQKRQIAAERQRCQRLCRRFVRGFPPSTGQALRASIRAESDLVIARIRQEYDLRFAALRQARLSWTEWRRRGCPRPPRIAPPPFLGPAGHGAGRRTGPGPGWRLVEAQGYLLVWEREGAPGDRITDAGGRISWTGGPHADAAAIAMAARWRRFDLSASRARLRALRPLVRAHGLRVRERPTDPPEWRQALARRLRALRKELRLALGLDGPTRRRLAGPLTQAPGAPLLVDGGTALAGIVLGPAPDGAGTGPGAKVLRADDGFARVPGRGAERGDGRQDPAPAAAMAETAPSPPAPEAPVAPPACGIRSEGPPRTAAPAPPVSGAPGDAALPGQARTSPATSEARAASAPDGAAAGRSFPPLRSAVRTDDGLARLPGAGVGAGEGRQDPPPARPTEGLPDGEADRQRAPTALEHRQALAKAEAEEAGKERREMARREVEGASAERAAGFGRAQAGAGGNRLVPGGAEATRHDARAEAEREGKTRQEADTDRERLHPVRGWIAWPGNPHTAGAAREAGAGRPAGLFRRSPVARAGPMPHADGPEVAPGWPTPDGEPPRRWSLFHRSDDGSDPSQPRPSGPVGDFLAASEAGSPRVLLEDLVHRIRAERLEGVAAAMLPGGAGLLFRRIAEDQSFEEAQDAARRRRDAEWSRGRNPRED